MSKVHDLTGQRFGRLVVLRKAESRGGNSWWVCQCDCGVTKEVRSTELKSGKTKSCGCLKSKHLIDLTGQRFGRLTVISRESNTKGRKTRWLCQCDCGNTTIAYGRYLRTGATQSCGCLRSENSKTMGKSNATHGLSHTRLYSIWSDMLRRCYNPKSTRYEDYGGRGITVCDSWRTDFMTFHDWAISNGYNDDLTIDRIDNDGNYCPENCRWATDLEQANNTRHNTMLTFNGKTQNMKQWSKELGISYGAIIRRLRKGWTVDEALSTPIRGKRGQ